jgi:hypothetical protein
MKIPGPYTHLYPVVANASERIVDKMADKIKELKAKEDSYIEIASVYQGVGGYTYAIITTRSYQSSITRPPANARNRFKKIRSAQ